MGKREILNRTEGGERAGGGGKKGGQVEGKLSSLPKWGKRMMTVFKEAFLWEERGGRVGGGKLGEGDLCIISPRGPVT